MSGPGVWPPCTPWYRHRRAIAYSPVCCRSSRPDGSVRQVRTLVLGGARSGKSAYAEALLGDAQVDYLATARRQPDDDDWEARISAHVARRPPGWHTVEPADLPAVLRAAGGSPVLVDDIATWLTEEL